MSVHEESHFISSQGLHPFTVSVNFYNPSLQSIYIAGSPHFKINSSHSYRFVCGKQENLSICLRSGKKFFFNEKYFKPTCNPPKVELNSEQCWTAPSINLLISCMYENHLIHFMANTVLPYYKITDILSVEKDIGDLRYEL